MHSEGDVELIQTYYYVHTITTRSSNSTATDTTTSKTTSSTTKNKGVKAKLSGNMEKDVELNQNTLY